MIKALMSRLGQRYRTISFPRKEPVLPERFRGLPTIDQTKCDGHCQRACESVCPTAAISVQEGLCQLDLGRCLFCGFCATACPTQAIAFTRDYRLATSSRADLIITNKPLALAKPLDKPRLSLYRNSLRLRQVCAGGCNGCEPDINVLGTIVFDLGRFGIQVVASPRHADGLLITGPVTENMKLALQKTYEPLPSQGLSSPWGPAPSPGEFTGTIRKQTDGAGSLFPIDLYIPGCPPHPLTILDGLLRLIDKR